jgi:hypothetical protein
MVYSEQENTSMKQTNKNFAVAGRDRETNLLWRRGGRQSPIGGGEQEISTLR